MDLFLSHYPEHFSAAHRTFALHRPAAALHFNLLRLLHLALCFAFYAICFYVSHSCKLNYNRLLLNHLYYTTTKEKSASMALLGI